MKSFTMNKGVLGASIVIATVLGLVGTAGASPTPTSVVTAGAEDIKDQVLAVGLAVVPFAATLIALSLGWKFARRLVRP